jgi:hypothetical protein
MARVKSLKDLKILEVSSVDRGAGESCRVVLMKREGEHMDTDFRVVVKKGSQELYDLPAAEAAAIINGAASGDSSGYAQLTAKAAELRKVDPSLTEARAFAKVFTDPANRELANMAKAEGAAASTAVNFSRPAPPAVADEGAAFAALTAKAAELRKVDPTLTEATAFAKAYLDPGNRELADNAKAEGLHA